MLKWYIVENNLHYGGYGNGYIVLPMDHCWYGKNYEKINDIFDN
jgi:hypothetical protein